MSNTPGYASVQDSIPEVIVPNVDPTVFTSRAPQPSLSQSYINFREHMYGKFQATDHSTPEQTILDIQFLVPQNNIFQFLAWSINDRQCDVIGSISIGSTIYPIRHGKATMYPFSGSYTSAVFFQYRLVLTDPTDPSKSLYFYGEKIARPWTFGLGLIANGWRIWENVSQQYCFLFTVNERNQLATLKGKATLAIDPIEYPQDQVFGVRTPKTFFLFYFLILALWFAMLTFNIVRTHINSNGREFTNYWTSSRGSFRADRKQYLNWDHSVKIPINSARYLQPHSVPEIRQMLQRLVTEKASVRLVGSGHTFNTELLLPRQGQYMLELSNMRRILELNFEERYVIVEGGVQLRRLVEVLHDHGYTLINHGAYLVQTVAGALSTGTHGTSGGWQLRGGETFKDDVGLGSLVTVVLGGEFVTVDGVVPLTDDKITTLGLFGVLAKVKLQIVPIEQNYLRQDQDWTAHSECLNYDYLAQQLQQNCLMEIRGPTGGSKAAVYKYNRVASISWFQSIYNLFLRFGLLLFYELSNLWMPVFLFRVSYCLLTQYLHWFPQIDVNSWAITKDYAPRHEETEWAIPFERDAVGRTLEVLKRVVNEGDSNARTLLGEFHLRFDLPTKPWLAPSSARHTMYVDLNFPHSNRSEKISKIYAQWQDALQSAVPEARPHWSKRYHVEQAAPLFKANYPNLPKFLALINQAAARSPVFLNQPWAVDAGFVGTPKGEGQ